MAFDLTPAELQAMGNMEDAFGYLLSERKSAERLRNHAAVRAYATAMKLLDAAIFAFEGADRVNGDFDRDAIRRLVDIAYGRDIFGQRRVARAEPEAC